MAEPHWTSYVGMVGGIIGSVTGIAGAIIAAKSFRRINQIKALDLRVELRRAWSDAEILRSSIETYLDKVNGSHERVLPSRSGQTEAWHAEHKTDKSNLKLILAASPRIDSGIEAMSPQQLESKLIEVHKFTLLLQEVKRKYDRIWESDEEARRERRQDMRDMVNRAYK